MNVEPNLRITRGARAKQTSKLIRPVHHVYLIPPDRLWMMQADMCAVQIRLVPTLSGGGGLQTWPLFHFPWLHYPLLTKLQNTSHFSLD